MLVSGQASSPVLPGIWALLDYIWTTAIPQVSEMPSFKILSVGTSNSPCSRDHACESIQRWNTTGLASRDAPERNAVVLRCGPFRAPLSGQRGSLEDPAPGSC